MTLAREWNLPTSRLGIAALGNRERAREFCEAVGVYAPTGIRAGDLATPTPPLLSGTAPRWRGMRAERNTARIAARHTRASLPEAVMRAVIVYLLSLPVFWFAAMDLFLFYSQGKSWLGPALDAILMVFGGGLVIISLIAARVGTQRRNGPVSR